MPTYRALGLLGVSSGTFYRWYDHDREGKSEARKY